MLKRYGVLTVGDLCVDFIIKGSDVKPEFGQKEKLFDDYWLEMGGSCSIFAAQAGKLGLETAIIGKVGNDMFGDLIYRTLEQSGVNVSYIERLSELKTGVSMALVDANDRAILTNTASIDTVSIEDIPGDLLSDARHLHIGSYFLLKKIQPFYRDILKEMKKHGTTVSLDTNWDPDEEWDSGIWDIMPYVDIFLPNETEMKSITKTDSIEKAIEQLKNYVQIIAVKKGENGATVYSKNETIDIPALKVSSADAIGAGDSFDAGFVFGFLSGKNLEECGRIGCICGSLNTRAYGGTGGQPGIDELLRYL